MNASGRLVCGGGSVMNGCLSVLLALVVCIGLPGKHIVVGGVLYPPPPPQLSVLHLSAMLLLCAAHAQAGLLQSLGSSLVRILRQVEAGAPEVGKDRFGDDPNPAVTNEVSARWGNMKRPPARQGLTGEDAESTAGATFPAIHRHAANHTVFATADAQSNIDGKKKSTVKTRARSGVDFAGNTMPTPNIPSGAPSAPALSVGNLVHAQT